MMIKVNIIGLVFLTLLMGSTAYATDIEIGSVDPLTENQLRRMSEVNFPFMNGYSIKNGIVTVVTVQDDLTEAQKTQVLAAIRAIPDKESPQVIRRRSRLNALKARLNLTDEELDIIRKGA